jgi:hypothetical protein
MASVFNDRMGRTWDVTLTMAGATRIDRSDFTEVTKVKDFSFLQPDKTLFTEIMANSRLRTAMIWAIVQPQVEQRLGINPASQPAEAESLFLESLDGPCLQEAKRAFMEAMGDFFPEHKTVLSTLIRQWQVGLDRVNKALAEIEPEAQAFLIAEVDEGMAELKTALRTRDKDRLKALIAG